MRQTPYWIAGIAVLLLSATIPPAQLSASAGCADSTAKSAIEAGIERGRTGRPPAGCGIDPARFAEPVGVLYPEIPVPQNFGVSGGSVAVHYSSAGTITALESGVVVFAAVSDTHKGEIIVRHRGANETYVGGLSKLEVKTGDSVQPGEVLGRATGSYRETKSLPDLIFASSMQTAFDTAGKRGVVISASGLEQGAVSVWLDGVYVAELNPQNRYSVALQGLRPATRFLTLYAENTEGLPRGTIEITGLSKDSLRMDWSDGVMLHAKIKIP